MTRRTLAALLPLTLLASACNKNETPTSATTTTAVTVAAPTTTEHFLGTVPVGGSSFYAFTVGENGTVNVTLTSVGGAGVPTSAWMGLGLGTPSAEDCTTTSALNAQSGASPQLTATYTPGIYCARIYDIGNLFAPATFAVTIDHP